MPLVGFQPLILVSEGAVTVIGAHYIRFPNTELLAEQSSLKWSKNGDIASGKTSYSDQELSSISKKHEASVLI
jgi:hypothetical protein